MARSLRIEYPGAWYHVMNRGLCRREVFHCQDYAQLFYDVLEEAHERYQIEIHAFCLMGNHYHLCVRTPIGNLSRAMRHINGVFTQRYNKLMAADGSLFRGRYKAIVMDKPNYFLQLTRYIHLNPVSAGIVLHPKDYPWSSYSFLFNDKKKPCWLYYNEIIKCFGGVNPIRGYEKFVSQGVDPEIKSFFEKSKMLPVLGSTQFVEQIKTEMSKPVSKEIPDLSRIMTYNPMSIEDILRVVVEYYNIEPEIFLAGKKLDMQMKRIAIYLAVQMSDKTQESIAKFFKNISAWGVSKIYCRIQSEIKKQTRLSRDIFNIKKLLLGAASSSEPFSLF